MIGAAAVATPRPEARKRARPTAVARIGEHASAYRQTSARQPLRRRSWGAWIRTRISRYQKPVSCHWTTPQRQRAEGIRRLRGMAGSDRRDPRRGRGDADAVGAAEGAAPAVRAAAGAVAGARRAGGRRDERSSSSTGPGEPLRGRAARRASTSPSRSEQNGTGDAVQARAAEHIADDARVIVLMGDVPLITAEAIAGLAEAHEGGATVMTMVLDDPGRLRARGPRRRRRVAASCEAAATRRPSSSPSSEVNTGIYCFDGGALADALDADQPDNAQGEYYLPDVLHHMPARAHVVDDPTVTLGVNDRADLAAVRAHRAGPHPPPPHAQRRHDRRPGEHRHRRRRHDRPGHDDRARQTTIKRGTHDRRRASRSATPTSTRRRSRTASPSARSPTCGPARTSSAARKAGTFVEIKNSVIGEGIEGPAPLLHRGRRRRRRHATSAPPPSPPTTTARTSTGRRSATNVKTSVDTTLVAPVTLGDDAHTAAGSVITEDVPAEALGDRARAPDQQRRRRRERRLRLRRERAPDPAAVDPHRDPAGVQQAADALQRPRQPGAGRRDRPQARRRASAASR